MALFPQEALNDGVRKREVFGWAMYDFANSGYTTVVLTAVFNVYFVGVAANNAEWATLAWTLAMGLSSLVVMLSMPAIGAYADLHAAKKRLLMLTTVGCVIATLLLAEVGRGDIAVAGHRPAAELLDERDGLLRGLVVEIIDDDARAIASEAQRHLAPDAPTRSGDDGDLPVELPHAEPPPC